MKKYHVNFFGVLGDCTEQEGKCPFGSFDSPEEAYAAYENMKSAETISTLKKVKQKEIDYTLTPYDDEDYITSEMTVVGMDQYSDEQKEKLNLINIHNLLNIQDTDVPFRIEDHQGGYYDSHILVEFGEDGQKVQFKIDPMEHRDIPAVRTFLAEEMQKITANNTMNSDRMLADFRSSFEIFEDTIVEAAKIRRFGQHLENLENPLYEPIELSEMIEDSGSNEPNIEYQQSINVSSPLENSQMYDEEVQFELLADYELSYGGMNYGEDSMVTMLEAPNGSMIEFDTSEIATVEDFRVQAREALKKFNPEEEFNMGISLGKWEGEFSDSIIDGKREILQDRDFFLGVAECIKKDLAR